MRQTHITHSDPGGSAFGLEPKTPLPPLIESESCTSVRTLIPYGLVGLLTRRYSYSLSRSLDTFDSGGT